MPTTLKKTAAPASGAAGATPAAAKTHRGRNAPPADRAAPFELKDQFGNVLSVTFPREKVLVLTFGDRDGSGQVEGWVRPLVERYDDRVEIRGVAVLKGVPALARPVVRRVIRSKVKQPVMLDWSGEAARAYGYAGGAALLVVVARDGRVVATKSGKATPAGVAEVKAKVDALMRSARAKN